MTTSIHSTESPETVVGFGFAEIAYLIRRFDTDAAKKSGQVLRLEAEVQSDPICVAGGSSLLGRGFASVDDDLELEGPAIPTAYALSKAYRWTEISLVDGEKTDTVVHVESDKVSLLMQPRTLGTWFVFAQQPDIDGADAQLSLIEEHTRTHPEGTAFIRVKSVSGEDHLLIRPDGPGWAVAKVVDPTTDVEETTGLDTSGLLARIRETRGETR
ncbi:hypothetical protein FBY31_1574 [Arthrobacter sp. SLBN-100]|uniref:hypothetical protein n=1 Tax=Arthrobacter sp. SLBN-100 TaxID=2768450 RepID=UPI00114D972B|nr:hypothetical protein [Arthrobacter sp. SLBN-100]TQJ67506.1 hypothetical protein FBY31_1574 [Arthrobacter sp. SLBN-100]